MMSLPREADDTLRASTDSPPPRLAATITPWWAVSGGARGLQMSFPRKIQRAQEGQRNMMQFLLTFSPPGGKIE